jgi:SAM-dependent methyltransferase
MDRARQTQQSYDRIAARFFERNRDRSIVRPWMHMFKSYLPSDGVILDLGAGPCHDSAELRDLGLQVVSVDRSRQMLTLARTEFPGPRVQADLRDLPFRQSSIAGVWASASLLHLDRDELGPALGGIARLLVPSGALFVSMKSGFGERYETSKYGADAPRWFTYWAEEELDAVLDAAEFELLESVTRVGSNDTWFVRIARRRGP